MGYRASRFLLRLIPCTGRQRKRRQGIKIDPLQLTCASEKHHPRNKFEEALLRDKLLVQNDVGLNTDHPVISIGLGFDEEDLINKKIRAKYKSYSQTHWDKVLCPSRELLECCDEDTGEPVVDGLPASIWEDCMEPSLSALVSLSSLKHRKSNLTKTKRVEATQTGPVGRHGDFSIVVGPVFMVHGAGITVHTAADVVNLHRHFLNNQRPESSINMKAQLHANRHLRHKKNMRVWRRHQCKLTKHQRMSIDMAASERWAQEKKRAKRARSCIYEEKRQNCQADVNTTACSSDFPVLTQSTESSEEREHTTARAAPKQTDENTTSLTDES